MLAHDGVNFIDGDMFAHGLGQPIKLPGFIAGILRALSSGASPALAQAVEQRPGKGIAVEQAMEIGAERRPSSLIAPSSTACPALCSCSRGGQPASRRVSPI